MVGLVAGCYSSVFITGPLWYVMKTRFGRNRVEEKPLAAAASSADEAAESTSADQPQNAESRTGNSDSTKGAKKDKTSYQSIKPKRGRNRR